MLEIWKGYNIRTKSVILYTRTSVLNKEVVATQILIDILPCLYGKGGLTFVSSAPTRASKLQAELSARISALPRGEGKSPKLVQQNIRLKAESSRMTCRFLSGLQVFWMSSDIGEELEQAPTLTLPRGEGISCPPKRSRRCVWSR